MRLPIGWAVGLGGLVHGLHTVHTVVEGGHHVNTSWTPVRHAPGAREGTLPRRSARVQRGKAHTSHAPHDTGVIAPESRLPSAEASNRRWRGLQGVLIAEGWNNGG
jgi:hypothetical protein